MGSLDADRACVLRDHVEEAADRGGAVCADEARDPLAVAAESDGGAAQDAVAAGEGMLGVHVDLRELDLTRAFGDLGFDRAAGCELRYR